LLNRGHLARSSVFPQVLCHRRPASSTVADQRRFRCLTGPNYGDWKRKTIA
jgi:hypothetical protein